MCIRDRPKEALAGEKVPLVVNPHGGPQGIRDSWGFNPETQLFASRGYATLQVNFRISGGYGKEFLKAGFKQVGRKVMDDVEDGVKPVSYTHLDVYKRQRRTLPRLDIP